MVLERERNAKRSVIAGFIQRIASMVLPFVTRTVIIREIGIEYAGINTLFTSILSVLSLAELGFGTAMVYSMYKPISCNDDKTICALLNFYKVCYRIIGTAIFVIGLIVTPFIPYLIKNDVPASINIYVIYLINLVSISLSYFLFAYKTAIFNAFQRNDVISWIGTIVLIIQNLAQIIVIISLKNYYYFVIVLPMVTIINNLLVAAFAKSIYPNLIPVGRIEDSLRQEIWNKVKSLLIYKIGNVVSNSVDNIVISSFLGTTMLAIYGNYYYIISALFAVLVVYYNAILPGIGNKIALENKEKNYALFEELLFLHSWVIGWMTTCLLCLFQDFMIIWMKDPKLLLDNKMIILFCLYFFSWKINDIVYTFKDAAGIWEYDRFRPLIASLCNLIINIILVNYIGVYGIVISTIACEVTFSLFWGTKVVFNHYFMKDFKGYLFKVLLFSVQTIVMCGATFAICKLVAIDNLTVKFLVEIIICLFIPNIIFILFNIRNNKFHLIMKRLTKVIKHD